jgi:hypothetical protein
MDESRRAARMQKVDLTVCMRAQRRPELKGWRGEKKMKMKMKIRRMR